MSSGAAAKDNGHMPMLWPLVKLPGQTDAACATIDPFGKLCCQEGP
jgi:hypothetical protein